MVIKNHLPLELYHNCLIINNLKDLTDFLVRVNDNPKMKEKLGIRDKAASDYTYFFYGPKHGHPHSGFIL